ncbi:MAG: DNA polymerase IV [Dethiobacter sp.]|jgi:DNA polymerase-4|nr:DNA polymerase IV [Dethiobacter sp.]
MRHIIHVDMNAFFASCHQAENPAWKGKQLLVAGDPQKRHGIILTASYEARRCGVKTAMAVWQARKLCPHAIFVPPDHRLYLDYSFRILEILRSYTPLVEPFSIDEAWLDVSGCERLLGTAADIGRDLQFRIEQELNIPSSIGISCNKFLAKMASERRKPRGFTEIRPEDVPAVLWPLPVGELVGVGRKMAPKLAEMGVETIGQLAAMPVRLLESRFGVIGEALHRLAHGRDDSPVDPAALDDVKSVGHSITLPADINNPEDVAAVLLDLSERVGRRLRHGDYMSRTITLTVKDHNFVTTTRSRTLTEPTSLTDVIYQTAREIYHRSFEPWRKVRLLGISASNLSKPENGHQLRLFDSGGERLNLLTKAVDRVRDRFGEDALMRARLYGKEEE